MFRDQAQRSEACLTLLAAFNLERFWDSRPNDEAFKALESGSLSSGETVLLRAALDIWNPGHGHAEIGNALQVLDARCSRALWSLLVALSDDKAIDEWIEEWS